MLRLVALSVRTSVILRKPMSPHSITTHRWNKHVTCFSGKRKDKSIKYLVTDSDTKTDKTYIADTLATSFAAKFIKYIAQATFFQDGWREATVIPKANKSSFKLSLQYAGAIIRNNFPDIIRNIDTLNVFKHTLKQFLTNSE